MENALARMAPSARFGGRGPTGNSIFTRRVKLWVQVSSAPPYPRPYQDTEEGIGRTSLCKGGSGEDEGMGPLRSPWGGALPRDICKLDAY